MITKEQREEAAVRTFVLAVFLISPMCSMLAFGTLLVFTSSLLKAFGASLIAYPIAFYFSAEHMYKHILEEYED